MLPTCLPFLARWPHSRRAAALALGALTLGTASCTTPAREPEPDSATRAERAHMARLVRKIEQLHVDLRKAEAAMLVSDSELSAYRNRASAVSLIVEARIALERAEQSVPWKLAAVEEGKRKLAEADRQLQAGRPPSAIYFASRAQHIADSLIAEARIVERSADARFVKTAHLNLRAGPSVDEAILEVLPLGAPIFAQGGHADWLQVRTLEGVVGWVNAALVSKR